LTIAPGALPRAARVATWVYFGLNGFAIGLWVVHLPNVEHATGISHSTLGLLLLVLGGAAFTGMQVAGPLVDRIGQRRLVPAAGVLLGLSLFGPGLADSWWVLGLTLLALGFGNGSLDVGMNAQAVVVERAYPRPIMSAFHAMWSIGGAFAALIGGAALEAGVPTAVSLSACGVLCIVVSLVASRFLLEAAPADMPVVDNPPVDEARVGNPDVDGSVVGVSIVGNPDVGRSDVGRSDVGWSDVGRSEASGSDGGRSVVDGARSKPSARLVWQLGALAFGLMLAEGVANDWAALHFRDILGTSTSTAAAAYGAFAVAMTVGRFATDRVAALVGPAAIVRYGAGLAAIGLATVIVVPWVPAALIGWALFGLGLSGGVPQLFTAAGNLDPRSSGALMARVVGLGYVGLLAGPAVIGGLAHWMPLNLTFVLPVVLCVLTFIAAPVLKTGSTQPPTPDRTGELVRD
jgi:MFS family permease